MLTGAGAFIFGFMYGLAGGTAAGIAAMSTFTLNMAVGATIGGIVGATGSALAGGDLGDVLKGAAVGAVQGAISSGPLHAMEGAAKIGGKLAHVVGHGVTGGAANVAMGGKFQDGFLSAAAGAASVHTGLTSLQSGSVGANIGAVGRTAAAAIIGGTASALGGGKFANGAYTAAFQHLLNSELRPAPKRLLIVGVNNKNPIPEQAISYWQGQEEGFFSTTTVYARNDKDFANALISNGTYDQLVYLGHGNPGSLAVYEGAGGNIISDSSGIWKGTEVNKLETKNLNVRVFTNYRQIVLCSCDSAVTNNEYGNSIAKAFASHFKVTVAAAGAGVGFDVTSGGPYIRNWRIAIGWALNFSSDISGGGGWKEVSP